MISLAAATSTHGGSDESAEHEAARLVHEAETALHDAREPGVDAWIASGAEHRGDRASRAGCEIQQAHQHQRFMRMTYRTYGKLLGLLFLIVNSTIGETGRAFMDWGWRQPFLFSAVLIIIALHVRLNVAETQISE